MKFYRGNFVFNRRQDGASMLIMIGVLAIVAIFAVVILRALLRETDVEVAEQEVSALRTYQSSLQTAVMREGYVPDPTRWATMVATNTGAQLLDVSVNKRRLTRVFLVDSNTTLSLPYTQPNEGINFKPTNVRMMLVSSLAQALPVSNGQVLQTTNFSALWNAAEGTASFPTYGPWAGWAGRSDDVKVQRIDLSPLFVPVYFRTEPGSALGYYATGTNTSTLAAPMDPTPIVHYYLTGTVLRLYNNNGTLDSTQVLNRRGSFKYEAGVWKGDPSGAVAPGGVDLAAVALGFLNSVPNMNARYGVNQQRYILMAMMDYMRNYNAWAQGGFTDNTLKQYLLNVVQPAMRTNIQGIFLKDGSVDYYPANTVTPCPP